MTGGERGFSAPDQLTRDLLAESLPLVSIIVVNFNYGRFLEAAVTSALEQTYLRIECIVVDNASTDETPGVLSQLIASHPSIRVIRRPRNDGQTPAALDGLAMARGAYVIFMDADDYLLPTAVEAHVFAHLSLRRHVGFTSGDMLQVADDQIVVATGEDFNAYVRSGRGRRPDLIRPFRLPGLEWPRHDVTARLPSAIHIVPPFHTKWIWAPTSGSCYRRDALLLFADNPRLADLRTGTDMYFAHAIGALCGSALIDEPVFAYRIHGGNMYTQRAQLDRTLNFRPGSSGDSNALARLFIIDHLVANAPRFAPNIWLKLNLVWLLLRLDIPDRDNDRRDRRARSRLARRLNEDGAVLRQTLGPWLTAILQAVCFLRHPV
jgi:glycosyltransferase involved in cell wall biosynthesis